MDIQKQVAFEKFHARDCNCDYEDLKRRLDRHELLTGHRYPPTSPRHEAWLTWCAAWDAKAQAVPEGFVLMPIKPTETMVSAVAKEHEGDAFLPYSLYDAYVKQAMIEAQEPAND